MSNPNFTFKSDYPVDLNLHPVGEEFAYYLKDRFTQAGVIIADIDNYDDIGWSLDTVVDDKKFFLLLGYLNDGEFQWLIQIREYVTRCLDLFKRKRNEAACQELAKRVYSLLENEPAIYQLARHEGYYRGE
jgi:PAS domain-containing protein